MTEVFTEHADQCRPWKPPIINKSSLKNYFNERVATISYLDPLPAAGHQTLCAAVSGKAAGLVRLEPPRGGMVGRRGRRHPWPLSPTPPSLSPSGLALGGAELAAGQEWKKELHEIKAKWSFTRKGLFIVTDVCRLDLQTECNSLLW